MRRPIAILPLMVALPAAAVPYSFPDDGDYYQLQDLNTETMLGADGYRCNLTDMDGGYPLGPNVPFGVTVRYVISLACLVP